MYYIVISLIVLFIVVLFFLWNLQKKVNLLTNKTTIISENYNVVAGLLNDLSVVLKLKEQKDKTINDLKTISKPVEKFTAEPVQIKRGHK
jgi:hypothetical protein